MSQKETSNRVEYYIFCIVAFAKRHNLSGAQSYRYLLHFKGLEFLDNHYEIEHTLSIDEALDDVTAICQRNGGLIS